MTITLKDLNSASHERFVELLEGVYEQSSWVASSAAKARPFATTAALKLALVNAVQQASATDKRQLLCHYASTQATDPALTNEIRSLHEQYEKKFGHVFITAPPDAARCLTADTALADSIRRRLSNTESYELEENLRQIHRLAELRLNHLLNEETVLGADIWRWCEELAEHTDQGFAELGQLTVTYLTEAHQACAKKISEWMKQECGFDDVTIDAVGNVVGIYHALNPEAPRLMTGSHYDTVRNGGKYDGRLGIFAPMAVVKALSKQGKRLSIGIEVIAFSEEEGQRYKAVFLGSGALTGDFNKAWLGQLDKQGISMQAAMQKAGLDPQAIDHCKRNPANYLGFVEVHIEQGPVLNRHNLPLGVVTSINGGVRMLGTVIGMASHAGTTPMDMRHDAAMAVAELGLYLEQRAAEVPNLVGTIGLLEVPNGSINVIPGRCQFSLDIRATTDDVRDACIRDVKDKLAAICTKRHVQFELEEIMRVRAAPSAPQWQQRWEDAVTQLGLPVFRMPSGAGHDAMKLHDIMPQAMLFVRGLNDGISHNPLEAITLDDADLCAQAFQKLAENLSEDQS